MNTSGYSLLVGTALAIAAMVPAAAEDQAALVKRGEYLLNGPVACANCHTPIGPDFSFLPGMDYAGGLKQVDPGYTTYSANTKSRSGRGVWRLCAMGI